MRLDNLIAQKLQVSRTKAQNLIKEGCVQVEGVIIEKVSFDVEAEKTVVVTPKDDYVSRGAYKLVRAIEAFDIDFQGKVVLDMGASTGGFTQVALKNGAGKVLSVDVGHGELSHILSKDTRVVNMEGRDIRSLAKEEVQGVDIAIGDLSFISLKHIFPVIHNLLGAVECVLLFKPQFECGKEVAKRCRGVIKDKVIHKSLLREMLEEIKIYDFKLSGLTHSSIKGKEGNIEYLIHLNGQKECSANIAEIVDNAFAVLK